MKDEFSLGIIIGGMIGIIIGGFFGCCIEDADWKHKIRAGKGPALIEAVQLEDKARELRRQ